MGNAVLNQIKGAPNGGTSSTTTSPLATKPAVGDKLVLAIIDTLATTGTTVTPPSGWTAVSAVNHLKMGSRNAEIFVHTYTQAESDANTLSWTFVQSANSAATSVVIAVRDGLDLNSMVVGPPSFGPASSLTQTSPSITSSLPAGTLVLSVQFEATAATETDSQVVVNTSGWTKNLWVGGQTNTILVASKTLTDAGTPGDLTSSWPNGTANRGSVQLAFPPLVSTSEPAVTVTAPANNSTTADSTPTFVGTGQAGAKVHVENPSGGYLAAETTVATDGTWAITAANPFSPGTVVYTVKQVSLGGVTTTASITLTYQPTPLIISNPTNGSTVSSLRPVLSGTSAAFATLRLETSGGADLGAGTTANASGAWSIQPASDLTAGVNHWRVTATDDGANYLSTYIDLTYDPSVGQYAARLVDSGGGMVSGYWRIWDGNALVRVSKVQFARVPRRVSTFYKDGHIPVTAHRLGSVDYAEHSARGMTECVFQGVDALEFSVAVTSDGKFFGLHDATLNRTSPDAPANYDPKAHTWAEIQAFQCQVGNGQGFGPQPYMLLDDAVKMYPDFVFVLDPKVIGSANLDAFFAYIQTIPEYKDRVILKYFHSGTGVADRARAIGCKSWGYSYADDVNAVNSPTTAATAAKWDYLGLEYSADQATWDKILTIAAGKPVWGHICPNAAAATTAVSKGATGLMVSGVVSVMADRYYK